MQSISVGIRYCTSTLYSNSTWGGLYSVLFGEKWIIVIPCDQTYGLDKINPLSHDSSDMKNHEVIQPQGL